MVTAGKAAERTVLCKGQFFRKYVLIENKSIISLEASALVVVWILRPEGTNPLPP